MSRSAPIAGGRRRHRLAGAGLAQLSLAAALWLALAVSGTVLGAQTTSPHDPVASGTGATVPPSAVRGEVLDAASGLPLARTTVILRLIDGVLTAPIGSGLPDAAAARSVVTREDGRYHFGGLAPGRYELHVQRIGYRPSTVEVELRGASGSQLSVGLVVAPIRLSAVEVQGAAVGGFATERTDRDSVGAARLRAARERQQRFAGTDVRELTESDVSEAVSLGDTDLLRALHRLPGVNTAGDDQAEPWVRGSRWDQVRVTFDGLPFFSPLHDGDMGTVSGFGTEVIGSALLFPGVRPAAIGEGAAAVLDLRSRAATPDDSLRGVAELSSLTSRLALSRGRKDARSGWSLATRHRTSDVVHLLFELFGGDLLSSRNNSYQDVAARWDQALGDAHRVEVSGIHSRDGQAFNQSSVLRASLLGETGTLTWRQTAGLSRHAGRASTRWPTDSSHLRSDLLYLTTSGEIGSAASAAPSRSWRAGYELTQQRAGAHGNVEMLGAVTGSPTTQPDRRDTLSMLSLWSDQRWSPAAWLAMDAGVRVDAGNAGSNTGWLRPMPRLQARARLDSATSLSVGFGRSYQYVQRQPSPRILIVPPFFSSLVSEGLGPQLWVLADPESPAIRSDIATAGVERWLAERWLVGANVYLRRSTGLLVRDPRPSNLDEPKAILIGDEGSRGLELSARRLAGRVTGTVAYTLAASHTSAAGLRFPSDEDRRETLDATAQFRATPRLLLGAAYTRSTGVPFTGVFRYTETDAQGERRHTFVFDAPNTLRAPATTQFDLVLEWSGVWWGARVAAYLQVRRVGAPEVFDFDKMIALSRAVLEGRPCAPRENSAEECRYFDIYTSDHSPSLNSLVPALKIYF